MVARVASFEGVNLEEAQRTMDQADAVIRPLVQGLTGYSGHATLVHPSGKVLAISYFDTKENAEAAEPTFDEEMPRKLGDIFQAWGGTRTSVGVYDVVQEERR